MIRKLAKSVREYKLASILSPIFISLEVLMEVLIPLILSELINRGINYKNAEGQVVGNMQNLINIGLILVGCCILSLIFGFLAGDFAAKASTGFARNLRHDMFYSIQNYSFRNIDNFSTSSLVTRLTTDVTNVQNTYQMLIRIAIRSPLMIIFSLTMSLLIHPQMGTVFLYTIPILIIALALIMKFAFPLFEKLFKNYDKLNRVVQENLRGIRVVKSFVREETEKEKFNEVMSENYKISTKAETIVALNAPVMQAAVFASLLLVSWFGAKLIVGSGGTELTEGELTSFNKLLVGGIFITPTEVFLNCA